MEARAMGTPTSLLVAVAGAAISAVAIFVIAVASLVSGHAIFSLGIGVVLLGYSLAVGLGAWLGWRRHFLARGLIVAPALLNLATAVSLLQAGDLRQSVGAGIAIVVLTATIVGAVLPSTQRALRSR